MDIHGFDVMAAFPLFNKWDNKACKYPRELCMYLTPWESGRDTGMWVRLGTNTQGTFDSPRMWRDISDEALIVKGKFTRSAAESCVFHRRIDGGLLVIGKNVDDMLVIVTPCPGGQRLLRDLQQTFDGEGWTMTTQRLGHGDRPFDMHSLVVTPLLYQGTDCILITQPDHLEKVRLEFFPNGELVEDMPETTLPANYSMMASACDPVRTCPKLYQKQIGLVSWLQHTLMHTAACSMIGGQGGTTAGPSSMDSDALRHLAGYSVRVGAEGAGLLFRRGPEGVRTTDPSVRFCRFRCAWSCQHRGAGWAAPLYRHQRPPGWHLSVQIEQEYLPLGRFDTDG